MYKPLPRGVLLNICEQNFTIVSTLFNFAQLFIRGNSRYLRSVGTGKYATPAGTLSGKLRTFPTVKSKTIEFFSIQPNNTTINSTEFSSKKLLPEKELQSGHYAAYFEVPVADTCYTY